MNTDQLQIYRRRLLEERDELTAEIKQHSEVSDLEVDSAVVSSEEKLLGKIDIALDRIEQGSYEICMGCGERISSSRLDAKPSVSLCTECQNIKVQK